MLQRNLSFATKARITLDGLSSNAFIGNVYGNLPYDGKSTNNNTVNKTLDKAEEACTHQQPFRGTFLLPLSHNKLKDRLESKFVTLLIKFPNNTLPFIPDGYWQGQQKQNTGCYNQEHNNIAFLLYEG